MTKLKYIVTVEIPDWVDPVKFTKCFKHSMEWDSNHSEGTVHEHILKSVKPIIKG